jgi:hypothetical protein
MRVYIQKKHHQRLLVDLADRLGTGKPGDALEHILNCWIAGPSPAAAAAPPLAAAPSDDPMAGLGEF